MIQKSQDQLSPLIKWVFSTLFAKWDYNNDLVVLDEETRYIRGILKLVFGDSDSDEYPSCIESPNSMHFQMAAIKMHRGVAPVTTAFTDMPF